VTFSATIRRAVGVRSLGCLPDNADDRDARFAEMLLGVSTPPPGRDLSEFVPSVLDQYGNSCGGQSFGQAFRMAMLIDGWGSRAFLPSPHALYYWARGYAGLQTQDVGSYLRDVAKAAKAIGFTPESVWPSRPSTLMKAPNITALKAAADHRKLGGYYRIPRGDTGSIRLAIAAGKPVVFGMQVGRSFVDGSTATIDRDSGKQLGGHAMVCCGYESDRFKILSSWGTSWSRNGFAWVTERRMQEAFDLWSLDLLSR
jgi:hypothetical protein